MKCETQYDLDLLYSQTSFVDEDDVVWDRIKVSPMPAYDGDEESPIGCRVWIPECSYFGGTMINMGGDYEQNGEDGLFLQELVRLYREGRLKVS